MFFQDKSEIAHVVGITLFVSSTLLLGSALKSFESQTLAIIMAIEAGEFFRRKCRGLLLLIFHVLLLF